MPTSSRTRLAALTNAVVVSIVLLISPRAAGALTISVLASGQSTPSGIAVDATSVYFTDPGAGTVAKVPVGGGATVVLASGQSGPTGIAVDGTSVYWTNKANGTVMKSALDGSGRVMLASGQGTPTGIAVDASNVYFTDSSGKRVAKVPIGGGAVTVLATQQKGATGIAVDATSVYWTAKSAGKVLKKSLSNGSETTLASGQSSPSAIAVNGTSVFWTNEGGGGTIVKATLTGGSRTTLATSQGLPTGIALDGTSVYWTDQSGGRLVTVLLSGGVPVTLASAQASPSGVATRGVNLVWTNQSGGSVMKGTAPARLFVNTVNVGAEEFIYQSSFQAYVDATVAQGINVLRVAGQWRERCLQCAPTVLDFNTEPSTGTFDFSTYFQRLDYAITTKGMRVVLSLSFAGQLDTDPLTPGAQPAMPAFMGTDDVMQYRTTSGTDAIFSGTPPPSGQTKAPRFEKLSVRQIMLDYVDAVVAQFRARYGDAILYYSFDFNTTGENEYPEGAPSFSFCDTSPDAKIAFQAWLPTRYASPQAVSTAWGHSPPFTSFGQIQILDGAGPPAIGQAPQAYLDFMAYREQALGNFLAQIRDHVHNAGGKIMAQYGSVWDPYSGIRGTFGFGRQIPGFDLVLIDDAPSYDHNYSMDYTRTNAGGVVFGNEADSVCIFACANGDTACCCNAQTFPDSSCIDVAYGTSRIDAQVSQSYGRGATFVDIANWDNFWQQAFPLFSASISRAVKLGSEGVTSLAPSATQTISLRDLYVHHEDWNYTNQLIATHNALGGSTVPIAVVVTPDL